MGKIIAAVLLFVLASSGVVTVYGKFDDRRKNEKELELLADIMECSHYAVAYADGVSGESPAIGPLMDVDDKKLLAKINSTSENEVDAACASLFLTTYKAGYNDGAGKKENKSKVKLAQLIKDNPGKKEEIEALYQNSFNDSREIADTLYDKYNTKEGKPKLIIS